MKKSESIGLTPFWQTDFTFTEPMFTNSIFEELNRHEQTNVKDDDIGYKILDRNSAGRAAIEDFVKLK